MERKNQQKQSIKPTTRTAVIIIIIVTLVFLAAIIVQTRNVTQDLAESMYLTVPFRANLSISPPTIQLQYQPVAVTLESIDINFFVLSDEFFNEMDSETLDVLCIHTIAYFDLLSQNNQPINDIKNISPYLFWEIDQPLCFNRSDYQDHISTLTENDFGERKIVLTQNPYEGFWYPFDKAKSDFAVITYFSASNRDGEEIEGWIQSNVSINSPSNADWIVQQSPISSMVNKTFAWHYSFYSLVLDGEKMSTNSQITFTRPVYLQIFIPFLFLCTFTFILMLNYANSLDTLMQGSLAILFGIFSLAEFLIPSNMDIRTILDFGILYLFVLFFIIVILKLSALRNNLGRDTEIENHNEGGE